VTPRCHYLNPAVRHFPIVKNLMLRSQPCILASRGISEFKVSVMRRVGFYAVVAEFISARALRSFWVAGIFVLVASAVGSSTSAKFVPRQAPKVDGQSSAAALSETSAFAPGRSAADRPTQGPAAPTSTASQTPAVAPSSSSSPTGVTSIARPVGPRVTIGAAAGPSISPEAFGAVGDGITDDTVALQRALDEVRPGVTLLFPAGKVYRHSDVLIARVAGEHLSGAGVLLATNEARSSFWITANNVTIDGGLTFKMAATTKRWDAYEQMGVRLAGVSGTVLKGISVQGSAAAGIYVGQSCCASPMTTSSNFLIQDVQVSNTRADGIQMTGGSHDGTLVRPTVTASGDDGISVVSYQADGVICNHITITSPTVNGTLWGRGLSVVGGNYVSYTNVNVSGSNAAALYFADEGAPYNTYGSSNVSVTGGTLTNSNVNSGVEHGAVMLYTALPGLAVQNVSVRGITIRNTRASAPWQIGVMGDGSGGSVGGISFADVTIQGGGTPFASDQPAADYATTGWTFNGASLADRS